VSFQELKNIYHGISAFIAAFWYGFPGKKIKVIGVTGTDGKSTTTHLIHHILKSSGKKASMISSIHAEIAGKQYDTGFHVTTPDPWMIQKFLNIATQKGDEFVVLETTSHGLDQNRVWGIDYEIGVITNVTPEHSDYHITYMGYLRTKEKLLKRARVAIVNRDDESFKHLRVKTYKKVVTYGLGKGAYINPKNFPFTSPLPGEYNRYNCLASIAVAKELGLGDRDIRNALKTFTAIRGRFEKFPTSTDFDVVIDFAHTPNAIEKVLSTIKPTVKGKLIHVFGSAGLRDRLKRPVMGEKSAVYADLIVLTEEDYRTEDVNKIIDQIAQGAHNKGAVEMRTQEFEKALKSKKPVIFRIPNRQEAIDFTIQKLARKGDTAILTGKAHEESLCRGKVEFSWSEHEAVEKALKLVNYAS